MNRIKIFLVLYILLSPAFFTGCRKEDTQIIKIPPVPDSIKMEGPYMYSDGEKGLHAATLYKFDRSKAAEALKLVNAQHAVFWGVPGFFFDVKVCTNAQYATELSGGA